MRVIRKIKPPQRMILFAAAFIILSALSLSAHASENEALAAPELTGSADIVLSGTENIGSILDGDLSTYLTLPGSYKITISSSDKLGGVYIIWNKLPGYWTYSLNGHIYQAGAEGFLHEYIALPDTAYELEICLPDNGAELTDIHLFGNGTPPGWVQAWEPPCDRADIMLLSTHSDDEQLFFAGILPYYAGELNAAVQVVYMTNHWDTISRPHEQLNGLWTVGIRNYPIIGPFPDDPASLGSLSESVDTVRNRALQVYEEEALIDFQVEMIRRFKPQVIIGHDIAGEYKHGAHIVNTYSLMKALEISNDASIYPDSAEKYGVWDIPKTYLHLYEENAVVMDWDIPLESFGGLTAFEVTKLGYACHLSQQWTWFTRWINHPKASDIVKYSPCLYGLYRTRVGADTYKNDFLENLTTYREQAEQAEAERAYIAETAAREAKRIAAQATKAELIAARAEGIARMAEEKSLEQESNRSQLSLALICALAVLIVLLSASVILLYRKRQRERSNL